ncbi:MAG: toxin-antitoxin system protein [Bacteroidales bacterium]|nr:toxin-antitoxin system protein [Bacteroidales bacterium]
MGTMVTRRQTAFRLSETLLDELKSRAAQCNRSLNNYVESILAQALYGTPNADTVEAIDESRAGKYAGTLDMSDFKSFLNSIDER